MTSSDGKGKTSNKVSHIKKSHMFLIYHKKTYNYWNVHQKITHMEKKHRNFFSHKLLKASILSIRYVGSSKKIVGKLNRYNFCSMPDRKFYPSSFWRGDLYVLLNRKKIRPKSVIYSIRPTPASMHFFTRRRNSALTRRSTSPEIDPMTSMTCSFSSCVLEGFFFHTSSFMNPHK